MTVLTFWGHRLEHLENGLAWCQTCGGAEGGLPEHCPQERMTEETRTLVYADELDYRRGRWTTWSRGREMAVRRLLK